MRDLKMRMDPNSEKLEQWFLEVAIALLIDKFLF
jgi:hypothetical protein